MMFEWTDVLGAVICLPVAWEGEVKPATGTRAGIAGKGCPFCCGEKEDCSKNY